MRWVSERSEKSVFAHAGFVGPGLPGLGLDIGDGLSEVLVSCVGGAAEGACCIDGHGELAVLS